MDFGCLQLSRLDGSHSTSSAGPPFPRTPCHLVTAFPAPPPPKTQRRLRRFPQPLPTCSIFTRGPVSSFLLHSAPGHQIVNADPFFFFFFKVGASLRFSLQPRQSSNSRSYSGRLPPKCWDYADVYVWHHIGLVLAYFVFLFGVLIESYIARGHP